MKAWSFIKLFNRCQDKDRIYRHRLILNRNLALLVFFPFLRLSKFQILLHKIPITHPNYPIVYPTPPSTSHPFLSPSRTYACIPATMNKFCTWCVTFDAKLMNSSVLLSVKSWWKVLFNKVSRNFNVATSERTSKKKALKQWTKIYKWTSVQLKK